MSVQERLEKFGLTMEDVDDVIGDGEIPVMESELEGFKESFFQEIRNSIDFCNGKIPQEQCIGIYNESGKKLVK